jgi:hypothetical protein
MRTNQTVFGFAALAATCLLTAPAAAQTAAQTDEKTDAEIGLEVESFALMCISSYIGQTVDQGKKVPELPDNHPIFFWRDISEMIAESNKRDWDADRTIVVEYNISRRRLLGNEYMTAEDNKIIENCEKVQKAIEADEAAPAKK